MTTNKELTQQIIQYSNENEALAAWELLKTQDPDNFDLRSIIEYCPSDELKNSAWELLKAQNPYNFDLRSIIEFCTSDGLKNAAGELLMSQNPDNFDLRIIIDYCPSDRLKNAAWELMMSQNPHTDDLRYTMGYCPSDGLKNAAWESLKEAVGVSDVNLPDQEGLIKDIAAVVTKNPKLLEMSTWHCGTTHCIAGWLCVLNPLAKELEEKHGTATAAYVLLPKYVAQFYTDNETALNFLKSKI